MSFPHLKAGSLPQLTINVNEECYEQTKAPTIDATTPQEGTGAPTTDVLAGQGAGAKQGEEEVSQAITNSKGQTQFSKSAAEAILKSNAPQYKAVTADTHDIVPIANGKYSVVPKTLPEIEVEQSSQKQDENAQETAGKEAGTSVDIAQKISIAQQRAMNNGPRAKMRDANIYEKDVDSDITGKGKHNRLFVSSDPKTGMIEIREDYQGLPMSTEQDRMQVANNTYQRMHGKGKVLNIVDAFDDGGSVWYQYAVDDSKKKLTTPKTPIVEEQVNPPLVNELKKRKFNQKEIDEINAKQAGTEILNNWLSGRFKGDDRIKGLDLDAMRTVKYAPPNKSERSAKKEDVKQDVENDIAKEMSKEEMDALLDQFVSPADAVDKSKKESSRVQKTPESIQVPGDVSPKGENVDTFQANQANEENPFLSQLPPQAYHKPTGGYWSSPTTARKSQQFAETKNAVLISVAGKDSGFAVVSSQGLIGDGDFAEVSSDGNPFNSAKTARHSSAYAKAKNPVIIGVPGGVAVVDSRIPKQEQATTADLPSVEPVTAPSNQAQPATSFKTAKGSTYTVVGNKTSRIKAARPEHPGDSGQQKESDVTFYVDAEGLNALGEFQSRGSASKRVAALGDGRVGVQYVNGPQAGKFERRTVIVPKTEPEKGLYPVELWEDGRVVHFGNEIVEVEEKQGKGTSKAKAPSPAQAEAEVKDVGPNPERSDKAKARIAARKKPNSDKDSIIEFIAKMGGISKGYIQDITGDTKNHKVPLVGNVFTDSGTSPDDMASILYENGYITEAEMNSRGDKGGVQRLYDLVSREMSGEKVYAVGSEGERLQRLAMEQAELEQQLAQAEAEFENEIDAIAAEFGDDVAEQERDYREYSEKADYEQDEILSGIEADRRADSLSGYARTENDLQQADEAADREQARTERNQETAVAKELDTTSPVDSPQDLATLDKAAKVQLRKRLSVLKSLRGCLG